MWQIPIRMQLWNSKDLTIFSRKNTFQFSVTPKIVLHGYYDNNVRNGFLIFLFNNIFYFAWNFHTCDTKNHQIFPLFFCVFWKIFAILLLPYEIPFRKMLLRNMNVEKNYALCCLYEIVKNMNSLPLKNKILLLQKLIHPAMNQMSKK